MKKAIILTINFGIYLYLNYQILSSNPLYYSGKDDGVSARFITHVFVISLSYFLLANKSRYFILLLGVFISVSTFVLSYLLFYKSNFRYGYFHLFAILLSFGLYYLIEQKYLNARKK